MAIPQSVFSFFLPNQRRRIRAGGGGGRASADPTLVKVLEGTSEILTGTDIPAHVGEFMLSDLEDAFTAKSAKSPYYVEGRVPPQVKISAFGLLSNPVETLSKAFAEPLQKSWQEMIVDTASKEISTRFDKAVWNSLFDKVWDRSQVPSSLQTIVDRWISRKDMEPQRRGVARAFFESPGMALMLSQRLNRYYSQIPGAQYDAGTLAKSEKFAAFSAKAQEYEHRLSQAIAQKNWALADSIQEEWKKVGGRIAAEANREFSTLVKNGGRLADSQEAQLLRFWRARNIHYGTLNFLRIYKKDGAWGVFKFYGWEEVKKRLKYEQFAGFISSKILGPFGLNRLANLAAGAQRTLRSLTSGLVKKGARWVIEKLGLNTLITTIGGALGSIIPGAGTVAGAIMGAVVQFVGEVALEKIGGVFKLLGYVLAGVVGGFVLFGIAVAAFISIILSNTSYPWEVSAVELDCNQSATTTTACVLPKERIKSIADNWGVGPGNHVNECYNDVIAKSKSAGIDPRISMAIWLNESNASNYDMYARLGQDPQDFGVPARAGEGFTAQINAFLSFVKQSRSAYPACYQGVGDVEGFFRVFCTAGREDLGVGSCSSLTDRGRRCVEKYLSVYGFVNAGGACN